MGMCLLALPSLMGIYAMAHLYITNVSGWFSAESNALAALSALTLGFDLYYTSQWGTSFFWHKTHVLAHFVFLISEYAALGYLQGRRHTQSDSDLVSTINPGVWSILNAVP